MSFIRDLRQESPLQCEVRLVMRVALFLWLVLVGAAIAEWRELHDRPASHGEPSAWLPASRIA